MIIWSGRRDSIFKLEQQFQSKRDIPKVSLLILEVTEQIKLKTCLPYLARSRYSATLQRILFTHSFFQENQEKHLIEHIHIQL